jgi:hypothetical protein
MQQQIIKVRILFIVIASLIVNCAEAQPAKIIRLKASTVQLHEAIFVSRDSAEVASLLHEQLTYGHSGGRLENREQALKGIISNLSRYNLNPIEPELRVEKGIGIVRYNMEGSEIKSNNEQVPIKLHIIQIWKMNRGSWKLIERQAVRL